MNPTVGEFTVCMDDKCLAPAEVVDDFELDSTSGPVPHRIVVCVNKHRITVPD